MKKNHQNPTYRTWASMVQRCTNPHRKDYHLYGGRGISIQPDWRVFENFLRDMGERPVGLELDRIDTNGNYESTNCQWATRQHQTQTSRLRRDNTTGVKGVTFKKGRRDCYWAYAEVEGIQTLLYRGNDFFEACCARKSWEIQRVREAL